jgi:sporulation-control protein spo0M
MYILYDYTSQILLRKKHLITLKWLGTSKSCHETDQALIELIPHGDMQNVLVAIESHGLQKLNWVKIWENKWTMIFKLVRSTEPFHFH